MAKYNQDAIKMISEAYQIDAQEAGRILNSIAKDFGSLGGNQEQQYLVAYYLIHGDVPKDVVDDTIGREVGNIRYNNLVRKIKNSTNGFFEDNPNYENLLNHIQENQQKNLDTYDNYDSKDIQDVKQSKDIINDAITRFNVSGADETYQERALVEYMIAHGELTEDAVLEILGKDSITDVRYNNIVTKVSNSVAEAMRDKGYMEDANNEAIIHALYNEGATARKLEEEGKLNYIYDNNGLVYVDSKGSKVDALGNVLEDDYLNEYSSSGNMEVESESFNDHQNLLYENLSKELGIDSNELQDVTKAISKEFGANAGVPEKKEQYLIAYYMYYGDLPKNVVDDVFKDSNGEITNNRYNRILNNVKNYTDEYFKNNPQYSDNYNSMKELHTSRAEENKNYNTDDLKSIRYDIDSIKTEAAKDFGIMFNGEKKEQALVEYYLTYGELPKSAVLEILNKKNINDDRYTRILTKVRNSVADAIKNQGIMEGKDNEAILAALEDYTQPVRDYRDENNLSLEFSKKDGLSYTNGDGIKVNPSDHVTFKENTPVETPEELPEIGDSQFGETPETPKNDALKQFEETNKYYTDIWSLQPGTTGYSIYNNLTNAERNAAQSAMQLADAQYQQASMQQAATVKSIVDQVRSERMAKLRAGMNEAQIANDDMRMMMSNINAMNDQMNAMNYANLQAQQQYNLAQDTAYKEYLTNAQAMNQSGAAYYTAQSGDPYTQALNYMKQTGASYSDALKAVTTGTTDTTKK